MPKNLTIGIIAGTLIVLGLVIAADGHDRGGRGSNSDPTHDHQGDRSPPGTPDAPAPSAPSAEQNPQGFGADPDTRSGGGIGFCGRWPSDYYCKNGLLVPAFNMPSYETPDTDLWEPLPSPVRK
jgi:hypothetical protein